MPDDGEVKSDAKATKPNPSRWTAGDPRIPKSPGRPKMTPERREAQRQLTKLARRAVEDVVAEARAISGTALDALEEIITNPNASEAARTSAARVVLDRAFGTAPQTILTSDAPFVSDDVQEALRALRRDRE